MKEIIQDIVLHHYQDVQAIYLFGSYASDDVRAESDIDIALLLPHQQAKEVPSLLLTPCHLDLEDALRIKVDLVNLRQVSTVFQKEIVFKGQLLYNANAYAVAEFEMLTLSFYQKLNEERREILAEFFRSKQAYSV
jgi:uncharacterized protein